MPRLTKSALPYVGALIGASLLAALLPTPQASYVVYIAGLAAINVILAVSLNLVNGFAGQFSLGHAGFMAVGGYVSALVTMQTAGSSGGGLIFFVACLIGGCAAALAGWLVGLPSLKLRGDYLAIVTLGFGEIVRVFIENLQVFGGATGLTGLAPLSSMFWLLTWTAVTVIVAARLKDSTHGRALLAIRDDEIAAAAMGIDTTAYKVRVFALSAFFAGIAGALLGHYLLLLTPKDFTFVRSIEVVAMIVLGGLGSTRGAIAGALLLTILPEALRSLKTLTGGVDFRMVIYSLLLVLTMILRPQGLFGGDAAKARHKP